MVVQACDGVGVGTDQVWRYATQYGIPKMIVVNGMDKETPIAETYRGVVPFLISDAIRTVMLLLFPVLSLALVRLMN